MISAFFLLKRETIMSDNIFYIINVFADISSKKKTFFCQNQD